MPVECPGREGSVIMQLWVMQESARHGEPQTMLKFTSFKPKGQTIKHLAWVLAQG